MELAPAERAGRASSAGRALFTPKSNIRIGCWNVRSLGKPSKQNSRLRGVLRTMAEKNVQLLALAEVRWPGHGVSELEGYTVVHSGLPEDAPQSRRSGVAVIMSKEAGTAWRKAGTVFTSVSDRILRVRMKSHIGLVSIIAVYAPTNVPGREEESEKFYEVLQECVDEVGKRDMLIVMGDFNARVGNDVNGWPGLVGRFGSEERNDNGERLLDFCAFNGMVITNTVFQHRPCHQWTWFHPAESGGGLGTLLTMSWSTADSG